jgi:hypothetical protein
MSWQLVPLQNVLHCWPVSFSSLDKFLGALLYPVFAARIQNVSVAQLCFDSPWGVSVDWFHDECSVHALRLSALPNDSVFSYGVLCTLAMPLYQGFIIALECMIRLIIIFLHSQYFALLCLHFHELFLSSVMMSCVPQQHPWIISYLVFMYVVHNTMSKHDFLVWVANLCSACVKLDSDLQ